MRKGLAHGQPFGRGAGVAAAAAVFEPGRAGRFGSQAHQRHAIGNDRVVAFPDAVPFEHGEFGVVQRAALPVAPDMGKAGDAPLSGRQQLLHGEFGRGVEVKRVAHAVIADRSGCKGMEVRFIAGRTLQPRRIHHDEILGREIGAQRRLDLVACEERRTAIGMDRGRPPRGSRGR